MSGINPPCRHRVRPLVAGSFLFLFIIMASAPVHADARKFTISDIVCRYLACQPQDGQEGRTTLEIEGEDFQKWAGNDLMFRVYRLVDQSHGDVVIDSKVDVTTNGHLATNIPVYSLSDGKYYLALYSAGAPGKPIAVGIFTRTTDQAAPRPGGNEDGGRQGHSSGQKSD
jgi:hypothetical protein